MADTFQNEVPRARIFRKEFEKILKHPAQTQEILDEISALAPK